MEQGICYINGAWSTLRDAKISIFDLGLVRGYGVFDYLRTYERVPFHLRDHLERFFYSARALGLMSPQSMEELEQSIQELLTRVPGEVGIKMILTGGESLDQWTLGEKPSLILSAHPFKPYPLVHYQEGIKVVTTKLSRSLPHSKTLHYVPGILTLVKARDQNVQEVLYLNPQEEILEATTSNFFAIRGNKLITSDSQELLLGITREVVLRIAEPHFSVEFRSLPLAEIPLLEEAFLTSSNREIMPVMQIDQHVVGTGKVGEKTRLLRQLFSAYTQNKEWPDLRIARYRDGV